MWLPKPKDIMIVSKRHNRKLANVMRNNEERFVFENKDVEGLIIGFNFWYDLFPLVRRPKYANSVMVNFNRCLPRHLIKERILAAFKEFT